MPAACPALQLNPETDWMYTADAGGAGLGLARRPDDGAARQDARRLVGHQLHGVRPRPSRATSTRGPTGARRVGATTTCCPTSRRARDSPPSGDIVVDADAHNTEGPLGVSVRAPVLRGAQEFVDAAVAAGIPSGDYNGRDRGGDAGVVSLLQTTTRDGKRSSTYHAFLEGDVEQRPNLEVISGAQVTRVILDGASGPADRTRRRVPNRGRRDVDRRRGSKEVVLSAGAVGSPQILLLSGIGPKRRARSASAWRASSTRPHVGKHLKDHLQVALVFPAPGVGVSMTEVGISMGPDALRAPAGPLPADPADDADLPAELQALKAEAERRLTEWATTGHGLVSSSLYDACAWFSTGLGDHHTHDAQIGFFACGYNADIWRGCLRVDPDEYFDDPTVRLGPDAESVIVLANPVQPHSEGEIVLASADPLEHPDIRMNYFADPHDMEVMVAVIRRVLDVVAHWPSHREIGPLLVPPSLAAKHGHVAGDTPSDALLEDLARHYSLTVYHLTTTCRMGDVVDPRLRVNGVASLRVADASVMPNVVSGNTNAASIMIGEKAAEMIAADHGVKLSGVRRHASAETVRGRAGRHPRPFRRRLGTFRSARTLRRVRAP